MALRGVAGGNEFLQLGYRVSHCGVSEERERERGVDIWRDMTHMNPGGREKLTRAIGRMSRDQ